MIIVPSLTVPRGFYELVTESHTVTFYSIVPLYKEELALKDAIGMERLLERLIDRDVDDLIRASSAKRRATQVSRSVLMLKHTGVDAVLVWRNANRRQARA